MAKSKYVTFEDLVRFHQEVIAPDLDRRMDARLDARLSPIVQQLTALDDKIDRGLAAVRGELADTRADMLTHFDILYTRLDRMATEHDALDGVVKRLETRVTVLE
jgi:hypothetical protein